MNTYNILPEDVHLVGQSKFPFSSLKKSVLVRAQLWNFRGTPFASMEKEKTCPLEQKKVHRELV